LPAALGVALRSCDKDGLLPSPQALNELERGLFGALVGTAGLTAASSAARAGNLTTVGKLISSKLGVVVVHLMLGAAAGVCVREMGPLYRALTSASSRAAQRVPPEGATQPMSNRIAGQRAAAAQPSSSSTEMSSPRAIDHEAAQLRDAPATEQPALAPRALPSALSPQKGPTAGEVAELSEVDLIERAHNALPGDPPRALAWLREHERRFPDGTFAQERDAIAIEALVGEGDLVGARARARLFLARFRGSAYAAHVESLVHANNSHNASPPPPF